MIHVAGQPEEVQYRRLVVPNDLEVKSLLVSEFHNGPYLAHQGVQMSRICRQRGFWSPLRGFPARCSWADSVKAIAR